jgi:hypothetical protein
VFASFYDIFKDILNAWREGTTKVRSVILACCIFLVAGGLLFVLGNEFPHTFSRTYASVGAIVGGLGGFGFAVILGLQKSKEEVKEEKKVEAAEQRVKEHPKETQVAWELARVKLESYLNRNLAQVKSIFFLTVVVMTVGFGLIGVGAYQAFKNPDHFKASVLSTISGVVVSFIGGTFLVLYKSTMAQAKDYVTILERINAVGMSVQILDSLTDSDNNLKYETTAEIAKQLLHMYSSGIPDGKTRRRKSGSSAV